MKRSLAYLVTLAVLAATAIGSVGCAHTGPDPCIGSYRDRLTMNCACPATLDPACPDWPNDDTKRRPTTIDGGTTP